MYRVGVACVCMYVRGCVRECGVKDVVNLTRGFSCNQS